jgi:hypothetical protein
MVRWLSLFVASWVAASISGAAGFGGALLLLPALTASVGAKTAVPLLTVAQLLGNLSRAAFGYREIRWAPAGRFILGAIPASVLGSTVFVALPKEYITRGIGTVLLLFVAARRTGLFTFKIQDNWLTAGGALVGLLSAMAGSAGPLGAALFLGLNLPATAYVASEATTAVAMHVTKLVVYQKYSLIGLPDLALGCFLGVAMVIGSWTGKRIIQRLPRDRFLLLVEVLMAVSALQLLATS